MKDFDAAAELYSAGISKFASRNIQSGDQVLVKLGSAMRPTIKLDITIILQSNISMENHGTSTIRRCWFDGGYVMLTSLYERTHLGFFLSQIIRLIHRLCLLYLDPRRQEDSEKAGRDFVSHWFHEDLSVCRWFHEISTLNFWSSWNLSRLKPTWQEAQSLGKVLCFGLVVSWQIYLRHSSTTCWRTLVSTSFTSYDSQLFNQSMFLSFLVKTSYFSKIRFSLLMQRVFVSCRMA